MTLPAAWRLPLVIAVAIVVADQVTKTWALDELSDGRTIHVIWTLQWNLAFNSGLAFGRGQGFGPLIGVVATLVIVWLLLTLRKESSTLSAIGMGCLIGGAAGNLIDRMFRGDAWLRGSVVDFIDFQWFPIFNIADIAINVGAGLLILGSILQHRGPEADEVGVAPPTDVDTPDR
ncbi:MAG: signal peptidase II [Actinomycetota bacterium]